jgi:NIMA-interacting peptidyl-prolyl cis-trans isomerase 1
MPPDSWQEKYSKTYDRKYYYNPQTGETTWNNPSASTEKDKVHVRHILVKHRDSRRPSSWKEVKIFYKIYDKLSFFFLFLLGTN